MDWREFLLKLTLYKFDFLTHRFGLLRHLLCFIFLFSLSLCSCTLRVYKNSGGLLISCAQLYKSCLANIWPMYIDCQRHAQLMQYDAQSGGNWIFWYIELWIDVISHLLLIRCVRSNHKHFYSFFFYNLHLPTQF